MGLPSPSNPPPHPQSDPAYHAYINIHIYRQFPIFHTSGGLTHACPNYSVTPKSTIIEKANLHVSKTTPEQLHTIIV